MQSVQPSSSSRSTLKRYLIGVILFNIGVILWGAYVRASGSGAGCGSHWPLCNGQVLPMAPSIKTQVEFFHRITSGLSLIFVLSAGYWVFKLFPKGSWIRKPAAWFCVSILMEAAIGAALVLFELVLHDQSLKRTISISLHFANTLVLLGSMVLTVASLDRGGKGIGKIKDRTLRWQVGLFVALFISLGMAGAVTALGDTLFPSTSLAHGLEQDLNPASHFLLKLRVLHPLLASSFVLLAGPWVFSRLGTTLSKLVKKWGNLLIALLFTNLGVGVWNLVSLAPIRLQIFHLTMAVAIWVVWVIFIDHMLVESAARGTNRSASS